MFAFLSPRGDPPDDGPAILARTAERLGALPDDDPVTAMARLSGLMSDLRSWSRHPDEGSGEALTRIDAAARAAYRAATRRHVAGDRAQGPHRPEDVRAVTQECLLRLAQSWLWLAIPWADADSAAAAAYGRGAPAIARGLRACAAVLKWSYLWHSQVPTGLWADACRLMACGESLGVSRAWVRLDPGADWYSCVEREFLKGCMLSVADPERMSPAQLDTAERVLEFCADALVLSRGEDRRLRFVIDLEDGAPPRPAAGPFASGSRSLGMDCYDVRLDDLIRRVSAGQLRAAAFGPVLDQRLVLHTLLQLRRRWTTHHH